MSKSREQRLTTKEHIETHTNLLCYMLQYCSDRTYCNTIGYVVFFYKFYNSHGTLTFKTKVLRLVSNVQTDSIMKLKANTALPCSYLAVTHDVLRY